MSLPKFNGRIQLTSATQTAPGVWNVEMAFADLSGSYTALDAIVGDIAVFDTSSFETGTFSRYTLTNISASTSTTLSGTITYHQFNDNAGDPDLGYSVGVYGYLARLSDKKDLMALPSPGIQGLSDAFAFMSYNEDAFNIVDNINGNTNLTAQVSATTVTVLSDTGTDAVIPAATATDAGVMTAADKAKLDGIAVGATNFTLTAATDTVLGGVKVGAGLSIDGSGVLSSTQLGLVDGDKGDITVSASGTTWTLDEKTVSNAKLFDVATLTIKGRATEGTGSPEDLTPTQVRTIINVADGATANSTDAYLLDRTNHTGTQAIATVTGLQAELDAKALAVHTHAIDSVTGLQAALDAKAAATHAHAIADVTGLQAELDAKALAVHAHAIADVTGLQAALDAKAAATHAHAIADVTGLQAELDAKQAVLTAGTNISIVANTISAASTDLSATTTPTTVGVASSTGADATIPAATATDAGVMTAADKAKLDGIAVGATNFTLTAATDTVLGGVKVGAGLSIDGSGVLSSTQLGLVDGDKGDITVSASGATWTIDEKTVSNAKLADVASQTIKGRNTADVGSPEDLTPAQVRTIINVADGATANSTDAYLLDRTNHTGTQAWSTLTGTPTTAAGYGITDVVLASQVGAANGVASLDADGKLPASQLPATAIVDTFVVSSEAQQLALTAQTGDVAVRTDLNQSFILRGTSASTLSDWQVLLTTTDTVLSVNGQTGVVNITDITGNSATSDTADTALAITGGGAGQIAYQSAAGVTSFTATGTTGYLLQSNGTDAPTWVQAPSGTTDLAIGTIDDSTVQVTSSTGTDATLPAATTTTAGVMTAADKTKLDTYPTAAPAFVQTKKTVVNNSITGYVQIIGYGTQTQVDSITVAVTSGNVLTVSDVPAGFQLQALSVIYGAGFNATAQFAVEFPEVFGGTSATEIVFPMMFHFNDGTPSVIQATSAINYSISGGIVKIQKTGLAVGVAARWRVLAM